MWRWHGVLLWLVRLPWLRFWPLPLPSVRSLADYHAQMQAVQGTISWRGPVSAVLLKNLLMSLKRLCRALAIAGAPRETIRTARRLKCGICQERKQKKSHRPAALPRARAFGDVVHTDLIHVPDAAGNKHWLLNIVDASSLSLS